MTQTETLRYEARGFTDEVTECEVCGKPELKGTVRLALVGPDGDVDGEVFAGVVCAARRAGRTAAQIRTEATRADRAHEAEIRAAYFGWQSRQTEWIVGTWTAKLGASPNPLQIREYRDGEEFRTAHAAWLAANPRPSVLPAGYR